MEIIDTTIENPLQINLDAESGKVLQTSSETKPGISSQASSETKPGDSSQTSSEAEPEEPSQTSSEADSVKPLQIGSEANSVKPLQIGSGAESEEVLQIDSETESEEVWQIDSETESEEVLQTSSEAKPDDPAQASSEAKPEDFSQEDSDKIPKKKKPPRTGAHLWSEYDLSKKGDIFILKPKRSKTPQAPIEPPPKPAKPLTESIETALADPYLTRHEKNLLFSPGLDRARNKHKINLIYDPNNLGMPVVREAFFANRPHRRFFDPPSEEPSPKNSETGLTVKKIMEKGPSRSRKKRTAATQQATSSAASSSGNKKISSKRQKKTFEEPTKQNAPKPFVGVVPCCSSQELSEAKHDSKKQASHGRKPRVIAGVPQPDSPYKTPPYSVVTGLAKKYHVPSRKHSGYPTPLDYYYNLPPEPRLCKKRVLFSDGDHRYYAESWDFIGSGLQKVGNTEEWSVVLRKVVRYLPFCRRTVPDEAKESSDLKQDIEQRCPACIAAAENAREPKRPKLERQEAQGSYEH